MEKPTIEQESYPRTIDYFEFSSPETCEIWYTNSHVVFGWNERTQEAIITKNEPPIDGEFEALSHGALHLLTLRATNAFKQVHGPETHSDIARGSEAEHIDRTRKAVQEPGGDPEDSFNL